MPSGQAEHGSGTAFPSDRQAQVTKEMRAFAASIPDLRFPERILASIEALRGEYDPTDLKIPVPLWRSQGFDSDPRSPWEIILAESARYSGNLSLYAHIPFCQTKCGFCDCFSVAETNPGHIERYVNVMLEEISAWKQIPAIRGKPVSVIQFGGGSPNYLPARLLDKILTAMADSFRITPETHLYMECNPVYFTPDYLRFLLACGVERISAGVQTLQEPLRLDIGRKQASAYLLRSLETLLELGFVVSADLLHGLPEESYSEFLGSAQRLADLGLQGISLYPFLVSGKNREFIENRFPGYQRDLVAGFAFFFSAQQLLLDNGFTKSFFLHFARKGDENLYYRHLLRGEDLVALGASADGIVGDYRFRNPRLRDYLQAAPGYPGHQGGVWESGRNTPLQRVRSELMAGFLSQDTAQALGRPALLRRWLDHGLLEAGAEGDFGLTASGSWFVDTMHAEAAGDQA